MKKLFNLFIALGIVTPVMSQQTSDQKSKTILDDLSKTTKSYSSIATDFSYTMENKAQKTCETRDGKLLSKGEKFKLEIANQTIVSDNKTVWTILKESKEVQINNVTKSDETVTPSNIYTVYEKGFKSEFVKEETKGGSTFQVIKLFPLDIKKKSYHTITITIDKGKKQLSSIKVFGKDGNDITYNVKKFTPNQEVPDNTFVFNSKNYPGYEIIDLRE